MKRAFRLMGLPAMMKRASLLIGMAIVAVVSASVPAVLAQETEETPSLHSYHLVVPLDSAHAAKASNAIAAAVASTTIPMWNYTVVSPVDGNTYSGSMVGGSPFFNGARTTNIPTYVIPLIIKTPDGGTFDPTVIDNCSPEATPLNQVLGSPVFQSSSYTINGINMGPGQYVDAFQRANFYNSNVSKTGESYHTVLSPITTLPAQTINIPTNEGESWNLNKCGNLGVIDYATFNSILMNTVMPALASQGVGPASFPFFVVHDVVMGNPGDSIFQSCCLIGYHGATGSPTQTYAVADYDTTGLFANDPNVVPISQEVSNWMDDPLGTNTAPAWGNLQRVPGCSTSLEVGNPMIGDYFSQSGNTGILMPNGITYDPQELAFFSWFYRESPSMGAGGVYSDSGTFTSTQPVCN